MLPMSDQPSLRVFAGTCPPKKRASPGAQSRNDKDSDPSMA